MWDPEENYSCCWIRFWCDFDRMSTCHTPVKAHSPRLPKAKTSFFTSPPNSKTRCSKHLHRATSPAWGISVERSNMVTMASTSTDKLPYAADISLGLSPEELAVLREQYQNEQAKGWISTQTKFNLAWGLVKGNVRQGQVSEGIAILMGTFTILFLFSSGLTECLILSFLISLVSPLSQMSIERMQIDAENVCITFHWDTTN